MYLQDIQSVFKELNGFPYKMHEIRVALLYNGFMSANIKALRIQKTSRIPLVQGLGFFRDTRFGFPDYQ